MLLRLINLRDFFYGKKLRENLWIGEVSLSMLVLRNRMKNIVESGLVVIGGVFKKQDEFERPTVDEAIEQELLFVDFEIGCIKNHHARKAPMQHIAYFSQEIREDIERYEKEYLLLSAVTSKKIRDHRETYLMDSEVVKTKHLSEWVKEIEQIDQERREFWDKANEEIIRKYYDKIDNYGLGFYHLYS